MASHLRDRGWAPKEEEAEEGRERHKKTQFPSSVGERFFLPLPAAAFSKTLYCGEEEEEEEVKAIPGEEVRGKEEEEERIWKKGGYGAALSSSFRTSPP